MLFFSFCLTFSTQLVVFNKKLDLFINFSLKIELDGVELLEIDSCGGNGNGCGSGGVVVDQLEEQLRHATFLRGRSRGWL